jgi:hypothetical protein
MAQEARPQPHTLIRAFDQPGQIGNDERAPQITVRSACISSGQLGRHHT